MEDSNAYCSPHEVSALVLAEDPNALNRIAQCYMGHLLAVGRCSCQNESNAKDAVQETLLRAAERLSQFRGDGSVKSWMSRMVVNACRCQERGRKNDPKWNLELDDAATSAGGQSTPEEQTAQSELTAQLDAALRTLKNEDRELFLLSQLEGVSAPEVAEMFGCSPDAIRARLTRVRRKLRSELDEAWADWG